MRFHWLGEWGMVYFEWPQRWLGFVLLALYALLFSALFVRVITTYYQRRQEFQGTWFRKLLWLIVWSVSAAVLANVFTPSPARASPGRTSAGRLSVRRLRPSKTPFRLTRR